MLRHIFNSNPHFLLSLQEQGSLIPQHELTKRLAMKWNTLSPEDKKVHKHLNICIFNNFSGKTHPKNSN